jgi:aryl-alcohol dehydrogenase-like predicted oxidoreductase
MNRPESSRHRYDNLLTISVVSLQDIYNLLTREEERGMLPLCVDEGVQTIVYSPLARARSLPRTSSIPRL